MSRHMDLETPLLKAFEFQVRGSLSHCVPLSSNQLMNLDSISRSIISSKQFKKMIVVLLTGYSSIENTYALLFSQKPASSQRHVIGDLA